MVQASLHIIPANGYSQTRAGHSGSCDCNPEIQPVPHILCPAHALLSESSTAFQGYSFCQVLVTENGLWRPAACCKPYLPVFSEPLCWTWSWWLTTVLHIDECCIDCLILGWNHLQIVVATCAQFINGLELKQKDYQMSTVRKGIDVCFN